MEQQAAAKATQAAPERASVAHGPAPESLPEHPLLLLRHSMGNRAVGRLLQTKLKVGPSGDRFEQEADRVAEQVMRMPAPPAPEVEPAESQVQRACHLCGEATPPAEEESQVRRLCKECEEEQGTARRSSKQNRPEASPAIPEESALSSGGEPLPSTVRSFYGERFGRDFGGVRLHTGPVSEGYSEALHAHAFTYGSHVWLGRGQAVGPSTVLAHELAHVVQQNRPPMIAPKRKSPAREHLEDHEPIVRRFEPYWEPYDMTGTKTHSMVLPEMGKANSIFTEAPVANAKTSEGGNTGELAGFGRVGQADLYKGSTTVGAYFLAHGRPRPLVNRGVKKDGVAFDHNSLSRPQVSDGALTQSADAPKTIQIGDLKPNSALEVLGGTYQLRGYRQGFEQAHKEAQDKATPGDGALWTPFSVSLFGQTDLTVPAMFTFGSFAGQTPQPLVIKQALRKAVRPRTPVQGNLCVRPHSSAPGIWVYAWVPNTTPTPAQLPARIRALAPVLQQRIIDPLLQSPVQPAKKSKPGPEPLPAEAPRVTREAAPVIRRKEAVAPEKDNFDYDKWKGSLKDVTKEFDETRATPEFKNAEEDLLANRAHEHLRQSMGLPLAELGAGKEAAHTLSKVEFWTGKSAAPFGFFRHVFGGAFVKVAQFFVKMRDKVRNFLKKMKSSASVGSGFLGAALKAAFKGLKMIARFVAGKIADRVMQSLITGVANKIKALIGDEVLEQLEQKAAEVDAIRQEIEKKATDTVDALLEKAFGVHLKDIEKLKEVYDIFQDIVTLVNLVRWGARVIACLSPPAFGCLWILAEAALDFAAQKVAETCWFQQKIQPLLAKVQYVTTTLPNKLADGLIAKVKEFLPTSVADVFADLETGAVTPGDGDVDCDEEDDKTNYVESPLHKEIDEMYQKIGPERAAALSEMARKMKVPKDRPLTASDISRLGDELAKVDPAKLAEYAKKYPAGADGMPADLTATLQDIENPSTAAPASQPAAPAPPSTGSTPAPTPDDAVSTGEKAHPAAPPATDQPAGQPGEKSGGLQVVDAASSPTNVKSTEDMPETRIDVVNPDATHDTAGSKPIIHIIAYYKGQAKVMIRNIETTVVKRRWYPYSAKTSDEAVALVIEYQVKNGIAVTAIPNCVISKGKIINGLVWTQHGREALAANRQQQAAEAAKK
jgi:hypothetical protein